MFTGKKVEYISCIVQSRFDLLEMDFELQSLEMDFHQTIGLNGIIIKNFCSFGTIVCLKL